MATLCTTHASAVFLEFKMSERDLCKSIIEFSFLAKAQLSSEKTSLLRSILSILIMEAEDLIEELDVEAELTRSSKSVRSAG
jgi:hypothetical protein